MKKALGRLRQLERQADQQARSKATLTALAKIQADPLAILTEAGLTPDDWQEQLLRSSSGKIQILACRQAGKSLLAAALALREALTVRGSLILLLSPTLRQSGELFRAAVLEIFNRLGRPLSTNRTDNALRLELTNGSRIIALPGTEGTIRGYSQVRLLVIDEAARVPDQLYFSVRPMLAVSRGRMICLSTAFGRRGWFFNEWESGTTWTKAKITADQCPRITAEFLDEERKALGPAFFQQEYFGAFLNSIEAAFDFDSVMSAMSNDEEGALFS